MSCIPLTQRVLHKFTVFYIKAFANIYKKYTYTLMCANIYSIQLVCGAKVYKFKKNSANN